MISISKLTRSKQFLSRQQLQDWMQDCRSLTLDLFQGLNDEIFRRQAHPDFSPVGWHLGHIGFTEFRWILEHLGGQKNAFPQYIKLFAADGLPKSERVYLPSLPETLDYLNTIRAGVFDYLQTAPIDLQAPIWRFLLQHESQHCETITLILQLMQHLSPSPLFPVPCSLFPVPSPSPPSPTADTQIRCSLPLFPSPTADTQIRCSLPLSPSPTPSDMLPIPAGLFLMGNDGPDGLDNERSQHSVDLETFWIDRYPVTCGQFRQFMETGGYSDRQWWSPEGWHWLQSNPVSQPLYWREGLDWDNHPVCGVSWYEADAYARFAGKRLPTEAEWEKAARWQTETGESLTYPWGDDWPQASRCNHSHHIGGTTPVTAYPLGQSPTGCMDLLGNVWEWTSSWFDGYPGFEPFPYRGYSQTYFDGQHRVLRGGSWATRPWTLRSAFRNWYHPHVREILAGFRCVRHEPPTD